jgi:hypothetical protein
VAAAATLGVPTSKLVGATASGKAGGGVDDAFSAAFNTSEERGFHATRRASIGDSPAATAAAAAAAAAPTIAFGGVETGKPSPNWIELPPDHVWIPLSYALYAAARILFRAPPEERNATLQRIRARSVSSEGRLNNDAVLMQSTASAMNYLKGIGGEEAVAAQLYGTEYQTRVNSASADAIRRRRKGLDDTDVRCIDLFVWLRVLVLEYREEQARRRATVRQMFNIAMANVAVNAPAGSGGPTAPAAPTYAPPTMSATGVPLTSRPPIPSGRMPAVATGAAASPLVGAGGRGSTPSLAPLKSPAPGGSAASRPITPGLMSPSSAALRTGRDALAGAGAGPTATTSSAVPPPGPAGDPLAIKLVGVSMRQFATIVQLIVPGYPPAATATLYRDAYVLGDGVVDYDSFMAAAEARQLWSHTLRLPAIMGAERASRITLEQASQLAYLVVQRVHCLDHDLQPWLLQLPPGWARMVARAREVVQTEIDEAMSPTPLFQQVAEPTAGAGAAPAGGAGRPPSAAVRADGGAATTGETGDGAAAKRAPKTSLAMTVANSVNLLPDGRRLLTAYRAYVNVLLHMRACHRADRGEAGGPQAMKWWTQELDHVEEVLRADATALAPDVLTLRRIARSGIPLRLQTLLQRQPAGLAPLHGTEGAGRRPSYVDPATVAAAAASGGATARPPAKRASVTARGTDLATASTIPLAAPGPGEAIGAEEYAVRLGVDAYMGDPIVAMRSHEAIEMVRTAARTACGLKLRRTVVRLFTGFRLRKRAA